MANTNIDGLKLAHPATGAERAGLEEGDPLPGEDSFAVYEHKGDSGEPFLLGVAKYALPDAARMTILRDGEFMRTSVAPLFGLRSPLANYPRPVERKEKVIANVDGKISVNGRRMPFVMARWLVGPGVRGPNKIK